MADKIDKSLTQGPRGSVTVPGEEQIQETVEEVAVEEQQPPGPIETTQDQNTLIPPSKPQQNLNETLQAQIAFIKEVSPGLEPESQIVVRKNFLDKALQKGLITEEDYNSQLQPLMGKTGEELTKMLENFENMVEQDVSEK